MKTKIRQEQKDIARAINIAENHVYESSKPADISIGISIPKIVWKIYES